MYRYDSIDKAIVADRAAELSGPALLIVGEAMALAQGRGADLAIPALIEAVA
jgi:hypothetical protein